MSRQSRIVEHEVGYGDPDVFYRDCYQHMPCSPDHNRAIRSLHRLMEQPFDDARSFGSVLEIGAGNGEHQSFVRHKYDHYISSDLRQPPADVRRPDTDWLQADALQLPVATGSVDRLVATCVLIHLKEPEAALAQWYRVTASGGSLTIYVPCESGMLLRMARRVTTARKAKSLGFYGYDLYCARDHVGRPDALELLIKWVFRHDELKIHRRPARVPSINLNAFSLYQITKA